MSTHEEFKRALQRIEITWLSNSSRKSGVLNAIGFANVINAYDPSLITVGGTVTLKNKISWIFHLFTSVFLI